MNKFASKAGLIVFLTGGGVILLNGAVDLLGAVLILAGVFAFLAFDRG